MTLTIKRQQRDSLPALFSLLTLALLFMLVGTIPASAATLYWDANGAAAGTGGTGNWNFTDVVWRDGGTTGTLQAWTDNNDVNLPTTAGTITLTDNITIGQNGTGTILSGTAGYTINADPGRSLTFDATGGTGAYRVSTNVGNLVINAPVILKGYTQNPRGNITFNGDISEIGGSLGIVKNLGDTMILNGNNSFTGGVNLSQGSLIVGHNNALGSGDFSWNQNTTLSAGGGDRTLANDVLGSWNYGRTLAGTNQITFTGEYKVQSAFGTSAFASLNVSDPAGKAAFTNFTTQTSGANEKKKKLGAGTMIMNGSFAPGNMNMTIEDGTMLVNTNATVTSGGADFLVTTGTLGGTGTINLGAGSMVDVAAGGMLAPGASIGTLTVNGDVNLDGTLAMEFLDATSDMLVVNGNLSLGSGSVLQYLGSFDNSSDYVIASYTGTLTGTFGSIDGFGPYVLDYGSGVNSQITLQFVPIPEPSSLLLMSCGMLGLLIRKRSRRHSV